MTNDLSGDLQIKPVGANSDQSAQNSGSVASSDSSSSVSPTGQGQGAAINLADSSTQGSTQDPVASQVQTASAPVNKRAFNLEADVDLGASGPAKPEKYAIPKMVKEKFPDLIELIISTESMDDQERQYWFQIMPIMTNEQIEKFRNILVTEKQQLADLDKEYEDELNRLNEKHLLEWKEFESKEKSRAIKEAEAQSSIEEKKLEEELLAKLSDV